MIYLLVAYVVLFNLMNLIFIMNLLVSTTAPLVFLVVSLGNTSVNLFSSMFCQGKDIHTKDNTKTVLGSVSVTITMQMLNRRGFLCI